MSKETSPVTEVFITLVKPEKYELYRDWASKIQEIEKTFPGYKGVYIQAPSVYDRNSWVTILQFDNLDNLDNWLTSKKREEIIKESETFVEHYETHRLSTPFPGWFPTDSIIPNRTLLAIKETMLVLLILFPIVMLEIKYLNPLTSGLNPSLSTFIGNAVSVSLISFPMMPICLYCLSWWLYEKKSHKQFLKNILGFILVLVLYIIEIILFSKI